MCDRVEILEAALDVLDECMVLLDAASRVVVWNQAAAELTGYRPADLLSRPCPENLYTVDQEHLARAEASAEARTSGAADWEAEFGGAIAGYGDAPRKVVGESEEGFLERPALVSIRHRQGHAVPAMLRRIPLRDPLGTRVGAALMFYPVEVSDALPHGEGAGACVERSQAEMEDRLEEAQHQWVTNRVPFGLLWVTIDQAALLPRTHGREAAEAMLRIMEQALLRGLRPGEAMARWGKDEFLVISHERTSELLLAHAQRVTGMARTAEFKWWGDRVNLTASTGASQAVEGDTLQDLLGRAQRAMQKSLQAGGNHASEVRGH